MRLHSCHSWIGTNILKIKPKQTREFGLQLGRAAWHPPPVSQWCTPCQGVIPPCTFFSILGPGPELGGLVSFEVRDMQGHRSEGNRRLLSAIPCGASPSQDCSEDCLDNRKGAQEVI